MFLEPETLSAVNISDEKVSDPCIRARCGHYKWTLQQDGARRLTPPEAINVENVIHRAEHDIVITKQPRSEPGGICCLGSASGDGLPLQKFQVCARTKKCN